MQNQIKEMKYLSVDSLYPHPDNPRSELGDLSELAESIKAKGVMQNLTVVPRDATTYTVIIGHRRHAAAKLAGLEALPCVIVEMSYKEQISTMLLENIQRSDLTVYEQAQSFKQLQMDFGMSVEDISSQTGFSQSTVRRRIEMAKLDKKTLKEVSADRQLSLGDFDKLTQIEDIKTRNEVLKAIGTNNFNNRVEYAITEQRRAKAMPHLKAALKKLGATEMNSSNRYSGKYEQIKSFGYLDFEKGSEIRLPKKYQNKAIKYYLLSYNSQCELWVKADKKAAPKRPQAEIEREKYISDVRAKLVEASERAYTLRYDFIKSLKFTKSNAMKILDGAIMALLLEQGPNYIDHPGIGYYAEHLKISKDEYENGSYGNRGKLLLEGYQKCINDHIGEPQIFVIYASFGDSKDNSCIYRGYSKDFPVHHHNEKLEFLYKWLISMGYEMSDEEKQLLDGTHPLFIDKDKKDEV